MKLDTLYQTMVQYWQIGYQVMVPTELEVFGRLEITRVWYLPNMKDLRSVWYIGYSYTWVVKLAMWTVNIE